MEAQQAGRRAVFGGEPGEINLSHTTKGDLIETHIGPDGRADWEIHHTDHGSAGSHIVLHKHIITWDERRPHLNRTEIDITEKQYWNYRRKYEVGKMIGPNSLEDNRFKSISDFKWCMARGGEVQFDWKGVSYSCFGCISQSDDAPPRTSCWNIW